jgi:hypothetical protein
MKLTGSTTEQAYRRELVAAHHSLFNDKKKEGLLSFLRLRYHAMRTAYVLDWIPEQGDDTYCVLIDAKTVVWVEVSREEGVSPTIVDEMSLHRYQNGLSKTGRIKLSVALDLASTDAEAK